jgi:hypothetical protein
LTKHYSFVGREFPAGGTIRSSSTNSEDIGNQRTSKYEANTIILEFVFVELVNSYVEKK